MVTITTPDRAKTAGIPTQWKDDIAVTAEGFIVGDNPMVVTEDMTYAANQTIAARTPVGFDGSGNLVPAVSATTPAVGFTIIDIVTPASGPLKAAPTYRAGTFNPALAVWPASYDTLEKKLEAFRGAPTPTNIIMRPVATMAVPQP